MGAHRMAVAACSVRVVEQLKLEIDQLIKTIDLSSPRSTDPNLARFVAAADLLSAHRSYEAAEALLHLLLDTHAGGIAKRALIGAMARSPNAALVDGLLDALEGGKIHTAWLRQPRSWASGESPWRSVPSSSWLNPAQTPPLARRRSPLWDASATSHRSTRCSPRSRTVTSPKRPPCPYSSSASGRASTTKRSLSPPSARACLARWERSSAGTADQNYLLLLFRSAELEGPAGLGALQGLGYLGDPCDSSPDRGHSQPRALPRTGGLWGTGDHHRSSRGSGGEPPPKSMDALVG